MLLLSPGKGKGIKIPLAYRSANCRLTIINISSTPMTRFFKIYLPLCILSALAACSDGPTDNGNILPEGYSRITLSLSASPELSTRAPWNDANAEKEEMMKSALVIMCNDTDGKVEKIFSLPMTEWKEKDNVGTITIENGSYTFYSFGNIEYTPGTTDGKESVTVNGIKFVVGLPVPAEMETSTMKAEFNNFVIPVDPSTLQGIPMTNKETYLIDSSKSITLHLFRMLSKIEFEFTNNTADPIHVQNITLGEVTKNGSDIYFLPPKQGENIVNRFPDPDNVENVPLTVYDCGTEAGIKIPENSLGKAKAYFNESVSKHPTKQMPLTITMKRKGDATDTRNVLMNITDIPRNTYVVVPISLTDYMMDLKVFAYAPIGGYPPYKLEVTEKEFYCTFSAGGDFAIRPFVYKFEDSADESKWFELTDATKVGSYNITVSGDVDIFSQEPYFSAGEILGTLNGTPGTASVCLTVNLIVASGVTQVYTRTIYIII